MANGRPSFVGFAGPLIAVALLVRQDGKRQAIVVVVTRHFTRYGLLVSVPYYSSPLATKIVLRLGHITVSIVACSTWLCTHAWHWSLQVSIIGCLLVPLLIEILLPCLGPRLITPHFVCLVGVSVVFPTRTADNSGRIVPLLNQDCGQRSLHCPCSL